MKAGIWLGLGAALMLAIPPAVGAAVSKDTFKCESTDAKEIGKFGAARAKCISKCVKLESKGASVDCTGDGAGGGFDTATQSCVDATVTAYKAKVGPKCAGNLPPCGSYAPYSPNDVDGYTTNNANQQMALIDPVIEPTLMCDLDPAALACENMVVKSLTKYSGSLIKCLTKCYTRKQLKGANINCDPNNMCPGMELDEATFACILTAKGKTKAGISKKCPSFPACGLYLAGGVDTLIDLVETSLFANYAEGSPGNPFCASPSGAFLDPSSGLF